MKCVQRHGIMPLCLQNRFIMEKTYCILAVDDDPDILNMVKLCLEGEGYTVLTAANGNDACSIAQKARPDLVILDVMMPGCNGILATVRIRQSSNVPILMLSAKAEGSDRVLGLEAGADDYLTKPFFQQELLARVKALLRRYHTFGSIRETGAQNRLLVGDILLDTDKKQLLVRGNPVHVTATEYKILKMLMSNPGHVFCAEEIYERVWNSDAYGVENTVMVHISRIREKIEINPKKPEYLRVVWGIGYVFDAP